MTGNGRSQVTLAFIIFVTELMKTDLFVYEEAPKSNKKRYYKEFA
jgi:hypothetical protein